jgi:hypothetical protein
MIAKSRARFILPLLLLALAPLRLEAADATNAPATRPYTDDAVNAIAGTVSPTTPDDPAAVSGTYTPNPADLCDWSEGHIVSTTGVPPPSAEAQAKLFKNVLLKLAARLVDDQQKTPDPQIKAIVDESHLDNTAALSALTPAATQQTLIRTAFALIQAAKTDPLAAQVTNEFQISEKSPSPPAGAPASPPATNAPTAAAT